MGKKTRKKLHGTVQKVIKPIARVTKKKRRSTYAKPTIFIERFGWKTF